MGLFSKKASTQVQKISYPEKQAVATPLSQFLANQVGKGLPSYAATTGKELTTALAPGAENAVNNFVNIDAKDYFNKTVGDPATKAFKEDFLPVLKEGYAGGLRGSGRFRSEEDATNKFAEYLTAEREKAAYTLPQLQLQTAAQLKAIKDQDNATLYNEWIKTLPQFNPALQTAISFLNDSTSPGYDYLTFLDQGSDSGLGAGIGATLGGIGGFLIGGPVGAVVGSQAGAAIGSQF